MSTILIVDDDPIIVKLMSISLESAGYETLAARNGKEGLESALKNDPDVIILDIMMPIMNGLEMLAELRTCSDIPVIIVSGYNQSDYIETARKLGIECFMTKPFDIDILKDTIDLVCEVSTDFDDCQEEAHPS